MTRYTVQSLNEELSELLAKRYPRIEVEGEVAQLSVPGSGHAYLSLRDARAQLSAVVWRDTWRGLSYRPERGDKVVLRGRLGIYPARGNYQLYVTAIARAGKGDLAAEIAKRRARLEEEGLLDPRRKRRLPTMPRVVGVATSLTGAALQDFLEVSRQRFPAARILVVGCVVQGKMAPGSVVQALDLLIEDGRSEVLVVTRGGGSKEDLLAFQDEGLARFLALSPIPTISAVGHQIDTTLCDLVADVVAPTPTAAAMAALPDGEVLIQRVDDAVMRLQEVVSWRLSMTRSRVNGLQQRIRHPGERLKDVRRRAGVATDRLMRLLRLVLQRSRREVDGLSLNRHELRARHITPRRSELTQMERRLQRAMSTRLSSARARLSRAQATANAMSPRAVLDRGYALVTGESGSISSVDQAPPGSVVDIHLKDGVVSSVVRDQCKETGAHPSRPA